MAIPRIFATVSGVNPLQVGRGLSRMQHGMVGKAVLQDRPDRSVNQEIDLSDEIFPGISPSFPSAPSCASAAAPGKRRQQPR